MTVEDYLEMLAGINQTIPFRIDIRDVKLLHSLATQTFKNIALTDKQHQLVKKKLLEYKDQFTFHGYINLVDDLDKLRYDYRSINRTKSIYIVSRSTCEDFFHASSDVLFLAIRFPFSKKMIKHINLIKSLQGGSTGYDSATKTHFVRFTENNVFQIVSKLKDCNFDIADNVLEYYFQIMKIKDNSQEYLPGIYNFRLRNVPKSVITYTQSVFGKPNKDNIVLFYDRKEILGLQYFDEDILRNTSIRYNWLTNQIICRKHKNVFINKNDFSLSQILKTVIQLDRLPILFVLGKNSNSKFEYHNTIRDQLYTVNNLTNTLITKKDVRASILFRLDNSTAENIELNQYIKDHNLNSKIEKTKTDIVYISADKFPKPLLASDWQPSVVIILDCSRLNRYTQLFQETTDLTIHYDNVAPYWHNTPLTMIP